MGVMSVRMRRLFALAMSALLMVACATSPPPPAAPAAALPPPLSPEEALKERVNAFWKARVADDLVTPYEFLPPEDKKRVTLTAFIKTHGGIKYFSYKLSEIMIDGTVAKVKGQSSIRLDIAGLPAMVGAELSRRGPWPTPVEEHWVLIRGIWYRPLIQSSPVSPPSEEGARSPAEGQ